MMRSHLFTSAAVAIVINLDFTILAAPPAAVMRRGTLGVAAEAEALLAVQRVCGRELQHLVCRAPQHHL